MGKSTSAALLREREAFGEEVLDSSGRLRRDVLARIVFATESRRRDLEAITHPRIRDRWERQVAIWRAEDRPAAVVVIPLLYETGSEPSFDHVVCIACSPRSQHQRLLRRGWSAEECARRRDAQWPIEKKLQAAQFVIWTEGDLHAHAAQWDQVLRRLGLTVG